jgi:DNA-binding transcriptional ArsR family regulator
MAAKLLKLPRRSLAELRQLVISFEDIDQDAAGRLVAAIDRCDAAYLGWTFVMLSPEQNRDVVRWLRQNSDRPLVAHELWAELFLHLNRQTGEVMATREELAAAIGSDARSVSRIIGQLEQRGAVIKRKEGRTVRYFLNPKVATHLPAGRREAAQAQAPELRLVND